jgi:hypothetical protein
VIRKNDGRNYRLSVTVAAAVNPERTGNFEK